MSKITEKSSRNSSRQLYSTDINFPPIYKELKFDPSQHRTEIIEKCANFWRYMYSQSDLKPVEATIYNGGDRRPVNKSLEEGLVCHCGTPEDCQKYRRHWFSTLMMLHAHGCDETAIDGTYLCRLCQQDKKIEGVFADEDPNRRKALKREMQELNEWQPDPFGPGTNVYNKGVACVCSIRKPA